MIYSSFFDVSDSISIIKIDIKANKITVYERHLESFELISSSSLYTHSCPTCDQTDYLIFIGNNGYISDLYKINKNFSANSSHFTSNATKGFTRRLYYVDYMDAVFTCEENYNTNILNLGLYSMTNITSQFMGIYLN